MMFEFCMGVICGVLVMLIHSVHTSKTARAADSDKPLYGSRPELVRWSEYKDRAGNQMVSICGAHFPVEEAHQIVRELKEFLRLETNG